MVLNMAAQADAADNGAKQSQSLHTTCCVVGGGPAGMMLGFLLARAGVNVLVLEKHQDFFRDFRGDTLHPSTLELMHELGLLDELLRVPHQQMQEVERLFRRDDVTDSAISRICRPGANSWPSCRSGTF